MDWFYYLIVLYLLGINSTGFIIMGVDKAKAKKKVWRIKEKTLFLIAIIGGSFGVLIGMEWFRHKTKHKSFVFGIPSILFIQVLLLVLYYMKQF